MNILRNQLTIAIALSCVLHVAALPLLIAAGKSRATATDGEQQTRIFLLAIDQEESASGWENIQASPGLTEVELSAILATPELMHAPPSQPDVAGAVSIDVNHNEEPPQAASDGNEALAESAPSITDRESKAEPIPTVAASATPEDNSLVEAPETLAISGPALAETAQSAEVGLESLNESLKQRLGNRIDNVDTAVAYRKTGKPVYPARSRARGEQGTVLLEVLIDGVGRPKQITVKTSSGYRDLDRSAKASVWRWLFKPPLSGAVDGLIAIEVPVTFQLNER